jgi:hypothetical protein
MDKTEADKSLMDKIAADPEIINRSVVDAGETPVVVAPVSGAAVESAPHETAAVPEQMGNSNTAPMLNLLKAGEAVVAPPVKPAAEPAVAAVHKRKLWPVVAVVVVALVGLGGVGYAWYSKNQAAKPLAQATPTVTPTPVATPASTPTATPTPTPTPSPAPVPQEVTAPAVAPTAEHPQSVTVTSKSGLWLRSTPNSSNKSNIVGWLPNGAQVSVDQVGDFWWHGSYSGKTGYFAVNYTH